IRERLDRALSADFELGDGGVDQSIYDHPLLDGRTSLVVSPENGRIPRTEEGRYRVGMPGRRMSSIPEGPEDRALDERCLVGGMLPLRGSAFPARIFQTPDHVVIHYEFINATITVPLDDRPQVSGAIQQWTGTSRGSWDGDTLVIESTNFDPRWTFAGSGAGMRLVQRLTRIDQATMHQEYTVYDPDSFTEQWSAEYPLTNTEEPIYEYACHEGNRSMTLMLNGARATEQIARFVGAFGLSSFERVGGAAADGSAFTDGMLSYDASGRVSVQLSSRESYLAYYGRYDVNVFRSVVEHEVEGGSRPDVRGRTLSYSYDLADDGDTLVLSLMGDDGVESRATWQRHR
ncbi:MAG: lipocalin-like domain-containing protein, partial [Acidobacteria bacterium]|nr:lipocalin-like domain-containing protein [Acidobacteriota bacterium]